MRTTRSQFIGITLIELMIAMTLGCLLLSFLMGIYLATRQSHQLQMNMSDVENNAERLTAILHSDIEQAGYIGCAYLSDDFPIISYPPYILSAQNKLSILNNNITVRHAALKFATLMKSMEDSFTLYLTPKPHFSPQDILVISDCKKAEIFATKTVLHSKQWQKILLDRPLHYRFNSDAEISRLEINTYFIGKTQRYFQDGTPIFSLYLEDIHQAKTELIEGVDNMHITSGVKGVSFDFKLRVNDLSQTWHSYVPLLMK